MKIKLLGLAVASTLLAACGGEADDPTTRNWQIGEVYYRYPYEGQQCNGGRPFAGIRLGVTSE